MKRTAEEDARINLCAKYIGTYCYVLALALLLIPLQAAKSNVLSGSRPNFVFILIDDLGWRDTGFAGAKYYETPNIDALARQGMTFTDAYSSGPNCAPTRACLMTGMYTPRHGVFDSRGGRASGNPAYMRLLVPVHGRKDKNLEERAHQVFKFPSGLGPQFVCLPELLGSVGYQSARLGKWHLGNDTQGFDISSGDGHDGPNDVPNHYGSLTAANTLTDRALRFVEENKDRPFFLYLSHWDVHVPFNATKVELQKWEQKQAALPADERENLHPVYAAMIERIDKSVGRVVQKIDELGLANKTLIVFTSDNGGVPLVSELAPLCGAKGSLFEAGVRVPACVCWEGVIERGSKCTTPISSIDFLPTLAELAGAKLPASQPVDGNSIVPLLQGKSIPERSIFWHFPLYLTARVTSKDLTQRKVVSLNEGMISGRGLTIDLPDGKKYTWRAIPATAIRRGKWKAIELLEDRSIGLYDLEKDPGERVDLSSQYPEIAEEMRRAIHAWQKRVNAPIPSESNPKCVLADHSK